MIEITVGRENIKIRGHANYAPPGQDIVCAGVTALTQALISSIEGLTKDKIQYDIKPGRVDIYYRNLSEKASALVRRCLVPSRAGTLPKMMRFPCRSTLWKRFPLIPSRLRSIGKNQ